MKGDINQVVASLKKELPSKLQRNGQFDVPISESRSYIEGWNAALQAVAHALEVRTENAPRVFKHGMQVRYRNPFNESQRGIGIVKGRPRAGSRSVLVAGPNGWFGYASVDELDIVSP